MLRVLISICFPVKIDSPVAVTGVVERISVHVILIHL